MYVYVHIMYSMETLRKTNITVTQLQELGDKFLTAKALNVAGLAFSSQRSLRGWASSGSFGGSFKGS